MPSGFWYEGTDRSNRRWSLRSDEARLVYQQLHLDDN